MKKYLVIITDFLLISILFMSGCTEENLAPTCSASADETNGYSPLTVTFSGHGEDKDGEIVSYNWNFGDGTISDTQNTSHQYSSEGNYAVTLTITDTDGGNDSITKTILVTSSAISGNDQDVIPISEDNGEEQGSDFEYEIINGNKAKSSLQPLSIYQLMNIAQFIIIAILAFILFSMIKKQKISRKGDYNQKIKSKKEPIPNIPHKDTKNIDHKIDELLKKFDR